MGLATNLLILLMCINFALYLAGYTGGWSYLTGDDCGGTCGFQASGSLFPTGSGTNTGLGQTNSAQNVINIFLLIAIAAGISGVALGILSGFSMVYIIPLALVPVFANLFIFPINFIFSQNMPVPISGFIVVFLNILLISAIMAFIRGSDF